MSFVKNESASGPCQYSVSYECNCCGEDKPPLFVEVLIEGHNKARRTVYLFGQIKHDSRIKVCPNCGTTIPTAEAIMTMEELKRE